MLSITCYDSYVSSIILVNRRDRTIPIFGIYLRFGYDCYLELENFEHNPLLLKPFEMYTKSFQNLDHYRANFHKVDLNILFDDNKVKKTLVISTPLGKHVVRHFAPRREPYHDLYPELIPMVAKPMRYERKNVSYGSRIRYLIVFKEGETETITAIDPTSPTANNLNATLTPQALESKTALEQFLAQRFSEELSNGLAYEVIDLDKIRNPKHSLLFNDKSKIFEVDDDVATYSLRLLRHKCRIFVADSKIKVEFFVKFVRGMVSLLSNFNGRFKI